MSTAESVIQHGWSGHAVTNDGALLDRLLDREIEASESLTVWVARRSALERLEILFASARVDNWDGAGSVAVDPSAYLYSREFLRVLPADAPTPEVIPDIDGEILFEWDFGPRQILTVSVGRDGTLSFAALLGAAKNHGTELLREILPNPISDNLARLVASTRGRD